MGVGAAKVKLACRDAKVTAGSRSSRGLRSRTAVLALVLVNYVVATETALCVHRVMARGGPTVHHLSWLEVMLGVAPLVGAIVLAACATLQRDWRRVAVLLAANLVIVSWSGWGHAIMMRALFL